MSKPDNREKPSYEELDHLVRCLDVLSTGAISVLGAARRLVESAPPGIRSNFTLQSKPRINLPKRTFRIGIFASCHVGRVHWTKQTGKRSMPSSSSFGVLMSGGPTMVAVKSID